MLTFKKWTSKKTMSTFYLLNFKLKKINTEKNDR